MSRLIDLSGQQFGRLTVIRRHAGALPRYGVHWDCVCACGSETVTHGTELKKGKARSCGCLQRELQGNKQRTHGMSGTPTFTAWARMKQRCYDRACPKYYRYGARGVIVCERWLNSFENFLSDMGEKPSGRSLDRIDNDGNYEPGNCRWATASQQVRNRSISKLDATSVAEIKSRIGAGERQSAIARAFGVTQTQVYYIAHGKQWADI